MSLSEWFNIWVGKILRRRKWQPIPIFLPGEFHRQRSLVGYSAWGCKESDTIEQLTLSLSLKHKASTKMFDVQAWAEYVVV